MCMLYQHNIIKFKAKHKAQFLPGTVIYLAAMYNPQKSVYVIIELHTIQHQPENKEENSQNLCESRDHLCLGAKGFSSPLQIGSMFRRNFPHSSPEFQLKKQISAQVAIHSQGHLKQSFSGVLLPE